MPELFRIHGDNIIECERIAQMIISETKPDSISVYLASSSVLAYKLEFSYNVQSFVWTLELFPGFNKSGRTRWEQDILAILSRNGSILDETPDVIITCVSGNRETILFAIEFCSALQAGNQAWQRSGRAWSVSRAGCPYFYVVDFVKYELDSLTRQRKNLRFPNPLIPFSYASWSRRTGDVAIQVYVPAEEFDPANDIRLESFDRVNFGHEILARYIVKRMLGLDAIVECERLLAMNFAIVLFLASGDRCFSNDEWRNLCGNDEPFMQFALANSRLRYTKTIAQKSVHGGVAEVQNLAGRLVVGISKDFPIGILPQANRREFAEGLIAIYPDFDADVLERLGSGEANIIFCMIKGFKPRGDDNRPDRGILPLAAMLFSECIETLTYVYGPITENNLRLLESNPERLASQNGLWKAILALTNYLVVDLPVIPQGRVSFIRDNSEFKNRTLSFSPEHGELSSSVFSVHPSSFHEDDVDTAIHYIFTRLLQNCHEGMCNPPGGDWSGLSLKYGNSEKRWLTLPRVSGDDKRPDHVLQFSGFSEIPLLLVIESKERSRDLESGVGTRLRDYVQNLLGFVPSVERDENGSWRRAHDLVNIASFEIITCGAYLRQQANSNDSVFTLSQCDLLFILEPADGGWNIEIAANPISNRSKTVADFLIGLIETANDPKIRITN